MNALPPIEDPGGVVLSDAAVHMVRTAMKTNLALSQMADQKASILMGAAFVVFTITTGQAARGSVPLSLMCLAVFAFLAAIMSTMAILPSTGGALPPPERRNMLFFGIFGHFSEEEFVDHLLATMATDEGILRAMSRDLYQNGVVLKRKKYRFLRLGYICLLTGLFLTFALFIAERMHIPFL
jgi:hypothetical protein